MIETSSLRKKLLDLAIRGHLTASWRNELEWEGELPSGWKMVKGKELFEETETRLPVGEWFDYIDIDAIDNKLHKVLFPKHLAVKNAPSRASRGLKAGDTVFSIVRPYLENIAYIDESLKHCIASTGFFVCRPKAICDSRYLYYMMTTPYVVNGLNSFMKGDNSPSIRKSDILSFEFPLPPLEEQKVIVTRLEELLALEKEIAADSAALDELASAAKRKILDQAIRGRLTASWRNEVEVEESAAELLKRIKVEKAKLIAAKKIKKEKPLAPITDDEKPFDLPEGWEWVRWGDISTSIQYGYNAPAKSSGKVRFVRISDIQNGRVMWETVPFCDIKDDEIDDYLLKPNDILFARTGGTVGKSYIVRDVPEIAIYAGYLIRTRCGSELEPMFFKYFMESDLYWSQLRSGTIATAQPNCNGQTLANMKLPLPPLEEQKAIVAKVDELFAIIDAMR